MNLDYDKLAELVADQLAKKLLTGEITIDFADGEHLDIQGVMKLLGVSRSKANELFKEHNLPTLRIDGRTRVARRHLKRLISERTRPYSEPN